MSHKYSIDEIDRMRAALWRKYEPPPFQFTDGVWLPGDFFEKQNQNIRNLRARAEDELRTCMVGGVRPEELEAKYPALQPTSHPWPTPNSAN